MRYGSTLTLHKTLRRYMLTLCQRCFFLVSRRSCFVQRKLLGSGGLLMAISLRVAPEQRPNGVALSKLERALLCNTRPVQTGHSAPCEPSMQVNYVLHCILAGSTHTFACKQKNQQHPAHIHGEETDQLQCPQGRVQKLHDSYMCILSLLGS